MMKKSALIAIGFVGVAALAMAQTPEAITTWTVHNDLTVDGSTPLPTQMAGATLVGDNIYIFGGNNGSDTDKVWRIPVNSGDGTLGASVAQTALPTAVNYAYLFEVCTSTATHVYIAGGGFNAAGPNRDNVTFTDITGTGDLGATWSQSASFPNGMQSELGGSAIVNGYLYYFGGDSQSGTPPSYSDVYYSQIQGDGSLGAWQTGTSLPNAVWFPAVTVVDKYIVVSGGILDSLTRSVASVTDKVWVGETNPSTGAIVAWTEQTAHLPAARYNANFISVNDTIFCIGGRNANDGGSENNVWRATINTSTGVVGTWASTDAVLPEGVRYHDVVYSPTTERLYVVSTRTPTGATNQAYISNRLFTPPGPAASKGWSSYQ